MSHVVTAPYMTVRVKNELGQEVLRGYYEGAVLPDDVHPDDLDRHVRKGMVAKAGTPEADSASPVGKPVQFDQGGMPMRSEQASTVKPADGRRARPDTKPSDKA